MENQTSRRTALKALLTAALPLRAETLHPGPQVVTFFSEVDGSDQPYGLYVPSGFDPARRYPLVVSLHGAGSNHRLNLRRVFGKGNRLGETDAAATRIFPPLGDFDFLVAAPLARGSMGYQGIAERDVYDVLADVRQRFSVDEDRIYLTGLASGGGGALWLALSRPDVWAAVAAVCPIAPPEAEMLCGNSLHLPVKLFQGEIDPVVPAAETRGWYSRLLQAGAAVEYVEYKGVRHNSWDAAYRDGKVFSWFADKRRNRYPERLRFASTLYKYRFAYWARLDEMTPGFPASIDAAWREANRLEIRTGQLGAFTLQLAGHPRFDAKRALTITVDGAPVRVRARPAAAISFTKTAKGWLSRERKPENGEKRAGLEGPVLDAISDRHIYVYATLDAPGNRDLQLRREQAQYAAEWSTARSPLLLTFQVRADAEVSAEERRASHLILFGNRATNRILAEIQADLPMHLQPGAADYGLLYVYPVMGRYAVVSSGLPWWTRADQTRRPGLPTLPSPHHALASFPDFVLFRGGLDKIVVEGRFDQQWRLPAAAAAAVQKTGAVLLRTGQGPTA